MAREGRSIYDDLKRDLCGFPVEDFVRAYTKAYLEADVETIRKLRELLRDDALETGTGDGSSGPVAPDAPVGAPIKPRPPLSPNAIALPEPEGPNG
jgi:hypothetical protein